MLWTLQDEETRLHGNTLLATGGRHLSDKEVQEYYRALAPDTVQRRPRAPKVTAGFLGSISTVRVNMAEGGDE